jgi:hypothetical protein
MCQTNVAEKIRTQFDIQKRFSENRAVYEIMWKTFVQPEKPHMKI